MCCLCKGPCTPPSLKPMANCLYPATPLPLIWPVRQKSCSCQLHSSMYVPHLRKIQYVSLPSGGASLVPVIQNMKTGNDGTECIEKQTSDSIPPLPYTYTQHWFANTLLIRTVMQLAHNWVSEYPTAQMANSQHSQTSQVEQEQTMSTWTQKLPTAERTKQMCSPAPPSLPKRFRWQTVGPACFRLNSFTDSKTETKC